MTPQPDRVAQVVAWLRVAEVQHFGIEFESALRAADAIEAGEPFKETPDGE